jgi:DNA-binding NarL/FixJ family response regulator
VRRIASGGAYVSPETAQRLVLDAAAAGKELPHTRLSNREYEVFRMIVAGMSVTEIGAALNVSVKTISTHKARILDKMELASQAELVRYAVERRLID